MAYSSVINKICFVGCVLFVVWILLSCNTQQSRQNKNLLKEVSEYLEDSPKKSVELLNTVQINLLNEYDYNHFNLLQIRACEKTGKNIASYEAPALKARNYFTDISDAPMATLSYFVLGSVFEAQGKMAKAMQNYLSADEWAEKSKYNIPGLNYSAIPYDIALRLFYEKKYTESLDYLQKTLTFIERENGSYTHKLYAVELKGLNFNELANTDSALYCYDKAIEIAGCNGDTLSRNRILYNKLNLLYTSNDYASVEKNREELSALYTQSNDSLYLGLLHLVLAKVYRKTNRMNLATSSIYQANTLLANAAPSIKRVLYDQLFLVEQKNRHTDKAQFYKEKYLSLVSDIEKSKSAEMVEVLAENERLKVEHQKESWESADANRTVFRKQLNNDRLLIVGTFITLIVAVFLLYKTSRKQNSTFKHLAAEECSLLISKQRMLDLAIYELQKPDGDKEMIEDVLSDLKADVKLLPLLQHKYGKAKLKLSSTFPDFNEKELEMCWHYCIGILDSRNIAEVMGINLEEFVQVKDSVEKKIIASGVNFNLLKGMV